MSDETTPATPAKKAKKTTPATPAANVGASSEPTTGQSTSQGVDTSPLETGNHAPSLNLAPQEVPQIINGIVVPRTTVTGYGHNHNFTNAYGKQTSKLSTKPTEAVRFSHPGLKAMVVRIFDDVKVAMEFLNNPNNALYQPKYVEPDTVHGDELQENVTKFRHRQSQPKKKQLIDAPIGSPDEFPDQPEVAA